MKKISPHLFFGLNEENFICETYIKAKSHRTSFGNSLNKCVEPFELIHTDVWGPSPVISKSGGKWYVIFVDDCTRMTWLYILKTKDEVSKIFQNFYKMIITQFEKRIKVIRSDNGTEYINKELQVFLSENGILHETSCVGTPQQNSVAERKNRHLLEITRSLLFENKVPANYWDNAITFAVYLMNRMPTTANKFQTPLQSLSSHVHIPSIMHLPPKVFGCSVYVHVQKHNRNKLETRAEKCVFLGFGQFQKGYKCYNPSTGKFYVTMDVTFLEDEAFFRKNPDLAQGEIESDQDQVLNCTFFKPAQTTLASDTYRSTFLGLDQYQSRPTSQKVMDQHQSASDPVNTNAETNPILVQHDPTHLRVYTRRNNRVAVEPNQGEERAVTEGEQEENEEEQIQAIASSPISPRHETQVCTSEHRYTLPPRINRGKPPARYVPEDGTNRNVNYPILNYICTELLSAPLQAFVNQLSSITIPEKVEDAMKDEKWIQAMETEMRALEKNSTWELVELPRGKHIVGCKWIYSIKYNEKGEIDRYRARLVAKGYTQTYGIDFQETFSPVAKLNTIRVILSLAANFDWPLHQFDVKNAFLHGDLEEEIYMEIPPGCCGHDTRNKVCKLKKALYGLKQSPRAWFERFCSAMRSYGYTQGDSDHTLFFKRFEGKITILIIYVDDMIITGDNLEEIKGLEQKLSGDFEMKNLGGLKYFLGIEVCRNKKSIFLSQRKYILDLLTEVGMLECKPAETPCVKNIKLDENRSSKSVNKERYQRLVGKLIYLSHTRPDIAYAVSIISQFMHNPAEEHMEAVMRIIRYLKGTPGRGIKFIKQGHTEITGYTDADWAGNIVDRKSTAGYFTFVGGNLVTWRSKKQNVVALSSAEAEFRGMVKGVFELLWIKKLLTELGFKPENEMQLFCDNKAAIDISHNPVQHDRTKHIEVDRHFIKEKLDSNIISLPFVRSQEQIADILTKAVGSKEFDDALKKIGMEDIYVSK
jgi:Reverse transcriptase (RNA-dependent DNA polymerase)/Integrase core domain